MARGHGDKGRGRLETGLTRGPVDQSKQAGKQQIQGETGERGIGWGEGRVERLAKPRLTEGGQPYLLQPREPGAGCRKPNS